MFDKVVFFNHFGNGDLFESREFVRELMQILPAEEYQYAHAKNKRMFSDFPELKKVDLNNNTNVNRGLYKVDNTLYINTWIGRDSSYVLPNIGCVVDMNLKMFNDMLRHGNLPQLRKSFEHYVPEVDFSYFGKDELDERMSAFEGKKKVLICNGRVFSLQAENFNFTPIIKFLISKHTDTEFFVTQKIDVERENLHFTEDITKTEDGFDLNEISYLATKCDVIIGRKSGPFVFAHPVDVWNDGRKRSLSFTYGKEASHFVRQDIFPLRKHWSPEVSYHGVVTDIERVLKE